MKNSEKGSLQIIAGILIVLVVLGIAFGYFSGRFKNKTELSMNQTANPKTSKPSSPSSSSPVPVLPSLPDLSQAASVPQQQFNDNEFPFIFYFPTYFVAEKTDPVELEYEDELAQVRVAVPWDDEKYDYDNCTNFMTMLFTKYSNEDKVSLYEFIQSENETYVGDEVTTYFETYKKSLSPVNYPRSGSYLFAGKIRENVVKEAYFEYGGNFYSVYLSGGCSSGEGFSTNADKFYTNLLQKLKFK